jgi:hypothetical protein
MGGSTVPDRWVVVTVTTKDDKFDKVVQGQIHGTIPAFDFCKMIDEDYKLLGEFFNTVYRHTQGENVTLENIVVD